MLYFHQNHLCTNFLLLRNLLDNIIIPIHINPISGSNGHIATVHLISLRSGNKLLFYVSANNYFSKYTTLILQYLFTVLNVVLDNNSYIFQLKNNILLLSI